MEVDHSVARIMNALRKNDLAKNTLVMFSSDHGPAPYAGNIRKATPGQMRELEASGHYPGGIHRGYKFSAYEGGLRVPLIARWPEVVPKGRTCDALVGLNDLMATFAELTAAKLDDDEAPDSVSFARLLREPSSAARRNDLVMQSVGAFVLRQGNWKLCLCPGSGTPAGSPHTIGNDPLPKVAWRKALEKFDGTPTDADLLHAPFVQLFDLSKDPHEDNNLAGDYPERVEQMTALLLTQVENGRSTPGPNLKNDRQVKLVDITDRRLPTFVRDLQN